MKIFFPAESEVKLGKPVPAAIKKSTPELEIPSK